jgi:cyclophilin family peptidyl-prolyl cis-trans isomerase
VRASAIDGLARLAGHAADSVYLSALNSDDNQLLMSAAAALKGSQATGVSTAVAATIARLNAKRRETTHDGTVALTELLRTFPGAVVPDALPVVKVPTPTFEELAAIEKATAVIEMADGGVMRVRLHAFDAPTNAARFVRLARAGAFDGLTFHRVAPFFVVQGPSPNANEYSAPDGPFARDELGVRNARATIGLSTRGRDTADGQIYINSVDNTWLDHEYTVMGMIEMATLKAGLPIFDTMQEGARIRRVTITP